MSFLRLLKVRQLSFWEFQAGRVTKTTATADDDESRVDHQSLIVIQGGDDFKTTIT